MRHQPPPVHRQRARDMRIDATHSEAMLWQQLRDRRMAGFKFRRQVPLNGYIIDFVCFEARMIVEVDGGQHAESAGDAVRDELFRRDGFRILRFWNDEVTGSLNEVCLAIRAKLLSSGE